MWCWMLATRAKPWIGSTAVQGDDVLYGDGGVDVLIGGDGNDALWSGDDGTILEGGAGYRRGLVCRQLNRRRRADPANVREPAM